jgi:hypothetical protein
VWSKAELFDHFRWLVRGELLGDTEDLRTGVVKIHDKTSVPTI